MPIAIILRRIAAGAFIALAAAAATITGSIVAGSLLPASAQAANPLDFRDALEPFGQWRQHPRFGEVWSPARRTREWRPYTVGSWVYTDEWGWYWVSEDEEEDFGWIVYHYGRWAFDRGFGWFWVPGDEWGPAWVNWRYGNEYLGWAALPPDELMDEYDDEPAFWTFLPPRYLAAPRMRSYYAPSARRSALLRSTALVNRTLAVQGRNGRLAVNAGISPASIAAASRTAIPTFRVRPRVLAGTQGVAGAVSIRGADVRRQGAQRGPNRVTAPVVQRTTTLIQPGSVAPPSALGRGERGRLGTHPPRAAQGSQPASSPPSAPPSPPPSSSPSSPPSSAPGVAPQQQQQQLPPPPNRANERQDQRRGPPAPPAQAPQSAPQAAPPSAPAAPPSARPPSSSPPSSSPPSSRPPERQERPEQRQERPERREPRTGAPGAAPTRPGEPPPQVRPVRPPPPQTPPPPPPPPAAKPAPPPPPPPAAKPAPKPGEKPEEKK